MPWLAAPFEQETLELEGFRAKRLKGLELWTLALSFVSGGPVRARADRA